jgi:internalin A
MYHLTLPILVLALALGASTGQEKPAAKPPLPAPAWSKEITGLTLFRHQVTDAVMRDVGQLRDLKSLHLSYSNVKDDQLRHLRGLRSLRVLELRRTDISNRGLQHLADLKNLEELDLFHTSITTASIPLLCSLPHLKKLSIGGELLTDKTLELLSALPLEELFLGLGWSVVDLSPKGMERLGSFSFLKRLTITVDEESKLSGLTKLTRLEELTLGGENPLSDAAVAATIAKLPRLEVLWLGARTTLGEKTAAALLELKSLRTLVGGQNFQVTADQFAPVLQLPRLQYLNLDGSMVDDKLVAHFEKSSSLRDVWLQWVPNLGDAGLTSLCRIKHLRTLYISGSAVTDAGLAKLKTCTQLTELNLSGCKAISDRGLTPIAELKSLLRLDLSFTPVSDASIPELAKLQNLGMLIINDTRITAQGADRLRKALPHCEVLR